MQLDADWQRHVFHLKQENEGPQMDLNRFASDTSEAWVVKSARNGGICRQMEEARETCKT